MTKQIKAAALISGGLDSMLAAKVIMEQGVHVEGLNFYTGFFGVGTKVITLNKNKNKEKYNTATWVAEQVGIKLHVIDITEEYKPVFLNPKYGYGANLNPCLDCKTFLVKKAKEWVQKNGFDFLITGEVIGQRPMSQRKDTLPIVARDSGADDLLLRPLCAKNLSPTKPEIEGWINREKLYDFSGRNRKPQIALAKQFGFENYPTPAGGCLLTEVKFCDRIKDLWEIRGTKDYSREDIELLKVGRHLRPRLNFRMIVGREHDENEFLNKFTDRYINMHCLDHPGPVVLIDGNVNEDDLKLAAEITASFSKARQRDCVEVQINQLNMKSFVLKVCPLSTESVDGGHI